VAGAGEPPQDRQAARGHARPSRDALPGNGAGREGAGAARVGALKLRPASPHQLQTGTIWICAGGSASAGHP
jgi:hypothetical protein